MKRPFIPYAAALLSGALLAFSFPNTGYYLLAWIAFVPLFLVIQTGSPGKAFFLGWISGLVYFSGTIYWVAMTLSHYGGLPWALSIFFMFLLVSYLALYVGLFSVFFQTLSKGHEMGFLLFAPSFWVTLEYMKGHFLTGFPWASLAYSQYRFLPVIQIADFGSIYSVGFIIVLTNTGLFLMVRSIWKKKSIVGSSLILSTSAVILTVFYGMMRLSEPMGGDQSLLVAVVQGNIPQNQKWDSDFKAQTVEKYKRLSLTVLHTDEGLRPDLVIWPEAALPFIFNSEAKDQKELLDLVMEEQFDLLVGAPTIQNDGSGKLALFNSAYLISQNEGIGMRYDKMHLVPFGEYIPFPRLLFFLNKLVVGLSDFNPGTQATLMKVGETMIGTVICYEVIFPELVRRFVHQGAALMTTITNDAWFGRSSAAAQHFSMVTFRAIENRVSFARAANSGISGFIDPYGRILHQTSLFVETTAQERLRLRDQETFYTQYGDPFAAVCGIVSLVFLSMIFVNRRKKDAL
ncbi:apolipoprotein N-acyltransferase [Nitrospira defluvii]|nr:apolipoprotein N-acyltransferase [Nitrospira defluvii]